MSRYRRPILAYGQSNLVTAQAAITAGDTTISIDNSGGAYAAGDHIFICSSANANYQYLGAATSATATTVVVPAAVETSLGVAAKVWQPTASVAFTRGHGARVLDRRVLGVIVDRSRGGVVYSTQTADDSHRLALVWKDRHGMAPSDYASVFSFLENNVNYGQKSFTLGYWAFESSTYRVSEVRYATTDPRLRTTVLEGRTDVDHPDRAEVLLELLVVTENNYA